MIINKLVFPIDANKEYVQGAIPRKKLMANDVNRDFLYVISPTVPQTRIQAHFKNTMQGLKGEVAYLEPTNEKVSELVEEGVSYYNLIKDWYVWKTPIPNKALEYVSHSRAGAISIGFNFMEFLDRKVPEGSTFRGEILSVNDISGDGAYVVNTNELEYNTLILGYRDLLIIEGGVPRVERAIIQRKNTPSINYSVDPSVYSDGVPDEDYSLLDSVMIILSEVQNDNIKINNDLNTHVNSKHNPHEVDSEQVGTYDKDTIDNKDADVLVAAKQYVDEKVIDDSDLGNYYNKQETDYKLDNLEIDGGTFI